MIKEKILNMVGGALSGALWAGVVLFLKAGITRADGTQAVLLVISSGILTGIVIALLFHRSITMASKKKFLLLPLLTLPVSIAIFSILNWVGAVQMFPAYFAGHWTSSALGMITTYLIGGLMSIFTPIFYALALLNQYAMRALHKLAA